MKKHSLREACQNYLAKRDSSRTYVTYASYWAREWGSLDVRAIDVAQLRKWREKQQPGWMPSTVNVALAVLSAILEQAIAEKRLLVNPVRELGWLKCKNERSRFWTPEEVRELLLACDEDLKEIIIFAIHSGMRIGEILALSWSDWQPGYGGEFGILQVRAQKSEERWLPLHPDAEAILRKRRRHRTKTPFPGKYSELYRRLKKLLVRLGIQEGAFHLARHTFASWLAKENESIYKVQKLLGHKSLQHTARYAKLQVQDLVGPLAALDRMKAKR